MLRMKKTENKEGNTSIMFRGGLGKLSSRFENTAGTGGVLRTQRPSPPCHCCLRQFVGIIDNTRDLIEILRNAIKQKQHNDASFREEGNVKPHIVVVQSVYILSVVVRSSRAA